MERLSGRCDLLIFDEGHRMKNRKSKLLLKLKAFRCDRRILLTGTLIQNNLTELFTCISIINPKVFGSETVFRNVFQRPILEGLGKKATP
jgi:SNF2 family DNA or RNA helicase